MLRHRLCRITTTCPASHWRLCWLPCRRRKLCTIQSPVRAFFLQNISQAQYRKQQCLAQTTPNLHA
uniref:Uncharacterized protein n=1 Tax=uncultured marine virus TaxID=186617 RepID=A0A0F7L5A4_9VIRU|nr:hypothetical protein [uncultured marine virus]